MREADRALVLKQYHAWLRAEWKHGGKVKAELLRLARAYKASGSLTLICSCAPKECHADVIKDAVQALIDKAIV